MTKDQYLEMMDQMGQEPDWERCPADIEDFPDIVIDSMNIFNSMGDRVYGDVGYIGKDYTNFNFLLQLYKIENKELVHEICLFLEQRLIEDSQKKIKAQMDKMKRKK